MLALAAKRRTIDFVTLKDALGPLLEDVGGAAYLASLGDGMPRSANAVHYGQIVREKAIRRAVIAAAQETFDDAYGDIPASELVTKADQRLLAIERHRGGQMVSPSDAALRVRLDLERRMTAIGGVTGLTTGFRELDENIHGWQPASLIMLAARTSVGKTALALCTTLVAAQHQKAVAYFSMEMTSEEIDLRLVSMLSKVHLYYLQSGRLTESQQTKVGEALVARSTLPIYVDDTVGISVAEIRAKVRAVQACEPAELGLIVIDYLQLARGGGDFENRTLEVSSISRGLKALAMELKVPVLALSQLSRAPEARKDKPPVLSDLRESGALEQDANIVLLLHRPDHKIDGPTDLFIEKHRSGQPGVVRLQFVGDLVMFVNDHT